MTKMQTKRANMEEERAPLSIRRDSPGTGESRQVVTNQEFSLKTRPSKKPETGK